MTVLETYYIHLNQLAISLRADLDKLDPSASFDSLLSLAQLEGVLRSMEEHIRRSR
jgi:hypothetical protein